MFGNTLAREYRLRETHLDFSRDEIRTLILHGIRFFWLPEEKKQVYLEAFQRDPACSFSRKKSLFLRPPLYLYSCKVK